VRKIVPARCLGPGEDRILSVGSIENPRAVLFGGNVAVEDLDDAVEIGNQCPDLRRFSQLTLVSNPTVFHFHAPMIRFGTLEDYLGALSQAHRKKLANPPEPA
jgi:hypothetical protein